MNIIYDISVLGSGFYNPRARTGIFRVVENLATELVKMDIISSFSPAINISSYFDCFDYLQSNSLLNTIPLIEPTVKNDYTKIAFYLHRHLRNLSSRSINERIIYKLFFNRYSVDLFNLFFERDDLFDANDIYHSLFHPVPKQVRANKKLKPILTVYDLIAVLYPSFFNNKTNQLVKNILSSIDEDVWVTCISQATKDDLCNYLPLLNPDKVFVTHLAASDLFYQCLNQEDISAVKSKFAIPECAYILSLSTLEPRKNIAQTIRCFARLIEQEAINDLSLVLVGTKGWDFDDIFNEITRNPKLHNKIIITGYVPDNDLAALYSGAMMFVYPSFYEGFGLPPLEAMQCGVPVITSNTSSLPEVVGQAGIMVEPTDDAALCQAMLDIYRSSEMREKMSAASLMQARKFSWQKCAEQTVEVYQSAVSY